ncbi:hypothetical protein JK359_19565 [Streptomyces actinomycinicus]|uniref:Lipoprotein n=1 Tax=Streptomyces actinomycinicus TaxID=1695166 RepID=A0A937EJ71_9ACTN|nr:hypothetical protein [Streptomyces actinomycinicus]MBL1084138.1 hypothetical protein [Streptomyces actinomycinicus]
MRKLLPLALTGLLAVSACQFVGGDDADDEAHRLNTMRSFPLNDYLPDAASAKGKAVGTAQWILARKCMVRLGFTGFKTLDIRTVESTYPVRQGTLASMSKLGDDSPYGVDDPDLAAEHGYHDRIQDEATDQPMEWPADQYTALTGTYESGESHRAHGSPIPEKGCMGEALRKISGPEPEPTEIGGIKLSGYYSVAGTLWYQAHKEAKKDPAWKKADREWSHCMKEKGFRYPGPDKSSVDPDWFLNDKPSRKEKKTAAADARCKLDTEYIQTVHAIESRAQKKAIARNKKALEEGRAADERTMADARKIVDAES